MSKSAYASSPISSVVGNLRPPAATHYRLVDSHHRTLSPQNGPPLHASLRVDSPDEIEFREERGYQRSEKREHKFREKALRTDPIERLMGLLFESQAHAAKSDRSMLTMVQACTEVQKELLAQQNALLQHAATINPPPPPPHEENWPSAVMEMANSLTQLLSTAIQAYGSAAQRRRKESVVDAVTKTAAIGSPYPVVAATPAPELRPDTRPTETVATPSAPAPSASPATPPPVAQSSEPEKPAPSERDSDGQAPLTAAPPQNPSNPTTAQSTPASAPQPASDSSQAQPQNVAAPSMRKVVAGIAWREMMRRIVGLSDGSIAQVLTNRHSFLEWLRWVVEPAELLSTVPT